MKKSYLWIVICIICISILIGLNRHLYRKIDLSTFLSNTLHNREYALWEEKKIKENPNYKNLAIFVDINSKTLQLINSDNNNVIKKYIIASGKKSTPSPIGSFKIIHKSKWGRSFGTRWMGLNVRWGNCH